MYFHTYTYALFLVLTLSLYRVLPLRGRQVMLLVASYIFYCWEIPAYGWLLAASTVLDYIAGLCLDRAERSSVRRFWMGVSLAGNLGILGFFKYADFFGANVAGLGHLLGFNTNWTYLNFVLPAGISFYTFQTLSYTIAIYRRQMRAERDLIVFALYVSYFPQLVAGPIERATNLLPQLKLHLQPTRQDIQDGLIRILIGLFRKLIIADRCSILVNAVYGDPGSYSGPAVWVANIAFLAQIYFDFAGYADIAIGSARLFGVHLMENFNHPLVAANPAEFWNRWHISLTSWFRDYVFLPLGGFRKGGSRAAINATIVLLLCGLWHGAHWHFVAWGASHAVILCIYYAWKYNRRARGIRSPPVIVFNIFTLLSILITFTLNLFSTVLFRAPDLQVAGRIYALMLGLRSGPAPAVEWYVWCFGGLLLVWIAIEICQVYLGLNERYARLPAPIRALGLAGLIALTVLGAVNLQTTYIYFQF